MNELAATIARRIRAEGPLSIAAYMAMALHDPQHGYYARRGPIGRAGDFITAPEISQVFGELIGLWCADLWQRMGSPDPVILAELGPGRGVLMADLLRAAAVLPEFPRAMRLYLVEASPVLRAEQQARLADAAPVFVESVADLPDGPLLLVANEFLDALPVRQLVRRDEGWAERFVSLDESGYLMLADGVADRRLEQLVAPGLRDAPSGTVAEICPAALAIAAALGDRFARQPGAGLFVDYGHFPSAPGPTLAAIRDHRAAPLLEQPGAADLSAHVDFAAFGTAAAAAGAAVYGPQPQGDFLRALGIEARLRRLRQQASPAQCAALDSGVQRLIDPGEMGTLFKAMAIAAPEMPVPTGFA